MHAPLELTLHCIEPSAALSSYVQGLGLKLEHVNKTITQCQITLEAPYSEAERKIAYLAKIELSVPGGLIYADSNHTGGAGHGDIYLAMQDAFRNAQRQLQSIR